MAIVGGTRKTAGAVLMANYNILHIEKFFYPYSERKRRKAVFSSEGTMLQTARDGVTKTSEEVFQKHSKGTKMNEKLLGSG